MCDIPQNIISRFSTVNNISTEESVALFEELESFLDQANNKKMSPSKLVDSAWHEFILHTKQYYEYCHNRFGKFIHHVPNMDLGKIDCGTFSE